MTILQNVTDILCPYNERRRYKQQTAIRNIEQNKIGGYHMVLSLIYIEKHPLYTHFQSQAHIWELICLYV